MGKQAMAFVLNNEKCPAGQMREKGMVFFIAILLFLIVGNQGFALAAGERLSQEGNTSAGQKSQKEGEKEIAAKVNGVDITRESVKAMAAHMNTKKEQGARQRGNRDEIEREALERLIMQELAYQKAKTEGLTADPKDIEKALTNLKKKLGTEENYSKFLEDSALTEKELLSQIERAIIVDRIYTTEVFGNISISEEEIKMEYEKEKDKLITPEKIRVVDILFFLDVQDKESMRKATKILEAVQSDENRDPWKLVPDGTFIVRELEVKKKEEKELYEAARKLQTGELSGVVIAPDSLHIIKLLEYTPLKQLTFEDVKGALAGALRKQVQEKKIREWENGLKKNATIEIFRAKNANIK